MKPSSRPVPPSQDPWKSTSQWTKANKPASLKHSQESFPRTWWSPYGNPLRSGRKNSDWTSSASRSTSATGTTSGPPYGPVILTGDFRDSEIIRNLLNSGYEPQTHKGKEFHAIRKDFGTDLRQPVLGNSRTNRVFASAEIIATAPDTASMKDFLDVLTGEDDPIRKNNLVLAAVESLGGTSTAAALTRHGVFNPEGQPP